MVLEVFYMMLIRVSWLHVSWGCSTWCCPAYPVQGRHDGAGGALHRVDLASHLVSRHDARLKVGKLYHGHLDQLAVHVTAARALSSLLCHSSSAVAPALSHLQLFTVILKNRAHRKGRAVC